MSVRTALRLEDVTACFSEQSAVLAGGGPIADTRYFEKSVLGMVTLLVPP
jgi:hypothetical protein